MDTGSCVYCSDPAAPACVTYENALERQYALYCDVSAAHITTSYINFVGAAQASASPSSSSAPAVTSSPASSTRASTAATSSSTKSNDPALSPGAVAGIAVGSAIGVAAIALAAFWFCLLGPRLASRRQTKDKEGKTDDKEGADATVNGNGDAHDHSRPHTPRHTYIQSGYDRGGETCSDATTTLASPPPPSPGLAISEAEGSVVPGTPTFPDRVSSRAYRPHQFTHYQHQGQQNHLGEHVAAAAKEPARQQQQQAASSPSIRLVPVSELDARPPSPTPPHELEHWPLRSDSHVVADGPSRDEGELGGAGGDGVRCSYATAEEAMAGAPLFRGPGSGGVIKAGNV